MKNLPALLAALMFSHAAYPAELFGTVDALSGGAFVTDSSGSSVEVTIGMTIYEGQTINSGPDGEVHLVTEDGGIIALRPDTEYRVDEYRAEGGSADKVFTSLLKGAIRSITGWIGKHNASAYRITTPTATIGVRGTDHETTVIDKGDGDEAGTYDTVNEGSTVVKTAQGEAEVLPGKFAFAPRNRAVAPMFLPQQPRFMAVRRLKTEGRIQQRKEYLHGRLEQMRDEHKLRSKSNPREGLKQIREQRSNVREQTGTQTSGSRHEMRGGLDQAMQNRRQRVSDQRTGNEQKRVIKQRGGGNNETRQQLHRNPEQGRRARRMHNN